MPYSLKELINIVKVYHELESSAKDFLFLASFALKHKDQISKSAQKTLDAIKVYKKLPIEIRIELQKDSSSHVSNILELEKICIKNLN